MPKQTHPVRTWIYKNVFRFLLFFANCMRFLPLALSVFFTFNRFYITTEKVIIYCLSKEVCAWGKTGWKIMTFSSCIAEISFKETFQFSNSSIIDSIELRWWHQWKWDWCGRCFKNDDVNNHFALVPTCWYSMRTVLNAYHFLKQQSIYPENESF